MEKGDQAMTKYETPSVTFVGPASELIQGSHGGRGDGGSANHTFPPVSSAELESE